MRCGGWPEFLGQHLSSADQPSRDRRPRHAPRKTSTTRNISVLSHRADETTRRAVYRAAFNAVWLRRSATERSASPTLALVADTAAKQQHHYSSSICCSVKLYAAVHAHAKSCRKEGSSSRRFNGTYGKKDMYAVGALSCITNSAYMINASLGRGRVTFLQLCAGVPQN